MALCLDSRTIAQYAVEISREQHAHCSISGPFTLKKEWVATPKPSDLGTFPSGNTFRVTKSMSCKKVEVVGATWGRFRPVTRLG